MIFLLLQFCTKYEQKAKFETIQSTIQSWVIIFILFQQMCFPFNSSIFLFMSKKLIANKEKEICICNEYCTWWNTNGAKKPQEKQECPLSPLLPPFPSNTHRSLDYSNMTCYFSHITGTQWKSVILFVMIMYVTHYSSK